ncbi:collagen-like triple helix repeat-containing protein [Sunxiuqinia dokdonensis]|uniref:Uncharacterized protein n=1 Tax=Sunxiuqinia dokdonensis TaxID=1409788 RepID=A0A0L8VBT8_9BACT|nr:collagen-like protein [Sunxiuqinia dokdonensis]KOH45813.1 hypothetical protein NC99_13640 [Sunxiuqinia dokdonensis]
MKLREITKLLFVASLVLFIIPACVKEGPPGIDGADGADGIDGVDGTDGAAGADGSAFCIDCHNTETMDGFEAQWASSGHATGSSLGYAGTRSGCADCHSGVGFVAYLKGGDDVSGSPINCTTCHTHGETPVFEDEAGNAVYFRIDEAVSLIADNTVEVNLEGGSNMCVNCHQSRRAYSDTDSDGNVITSIPNRYGPHYSSQANMLVGTGGREFAGSVAYPESGSTASRHAELGCVSCHMDESNHHFATPAIDACTECHGSATNFDVGGRLTEIAGLLEQLEDLLEAEGAMVDGSLVTGANVSLEVLGAAWNYMHITEDQSAGVHNPAYTKALLQNSIEALQ